MLVPKVDELKNIIIEYATHVETMIDKSLRGLVEKNTALLGEVINEDEAKTNDYDSRVDKLCTEIIAQFEPLAGDLRAMLMFLKMNKDLERMGDHAVNIAESAAILVSQPAMDSFVKISQMAAESVRMFKDSFRAFVTENIQLANEVCERDSIVDDLGDKLLKEAIAIMKKDPKTIQQALHLIRISHNLERIADLSTNICEEVIYIVEGKDIKHHHDI